MPEQIDLVYPLYLDVPMMTSFVAALEDGIAYGSDVTRREDQRRALGAGSEGQVGAGLPSMGIFSTLLNIDLRGKISGEQAVGSGEEVTLVRRHTEASLFMRLRHTLVNDDRILRVNDIGDLERLRDAEQDYLVEVRGQLFRSPFNEALEAVFRVMGMFGVELPEDRPARAQTGGGGGGRRNRGQSQQRGASAATEFGLDNEALQGLQLMKRIREDLAQSKVLDMIMIPSAIEDLTMVISLAQEFLPDGSVDNLLSGDYSVLGKVTRVVEGDDDINLYQRTVFRHLDSDTLDAVFAGMQQEGVFTLPDHPSHIKAPALQLLPMAIYA